MNKTKLALIGIATLGFSHSAFAQSSEPRQKAASDAITAEAHEDNEIAPTTTKVPFEGMDLTWINGQNRQTEFPMQVNDRQGLNILTVSAFADAYYNKNFNDPNDNTQTISSSIGRSNEVQLNQLSIGIESYYKNVIGRL